jgi:hypothetical protein
MMPLEAGSERARTKSFHRAGTGSPVGSDSRSSTSRSSGCASCGSGCSASLFRSGFSIDGTPARLSDDTIARRAFAADFYFQRRKWLARAERQSVVHSICSARIPEIGGKFSASFCIGLDYLAILRHNRPISLVCKTRKFAQKSLSRNYVVSTWQSAAARSASFQLPSLRTVSRIAAWGRFRRFDCGSANDYS